jgi:hypothetical protein
VLTEDNVVAKPRVLVEVVELAAGVNVAIGNRTPERVRRPDSDLWFGKAWRISETLDALRRGIKTITKRSVQSARLVLENARRRPQCANDARPSLA